MKFLFLRANLLDNHSVTAIHKISAELAEFIVIGTAPSLGVFESLANRAEARQRIEARQTRKRTKKPATRSALTTICGKTSAQLDAMGLFCPCGPCWEMREAIADLEKRQLRSRMFSCLTRTRIGASGQEKSARFNLQGPDGRMIVRYSAGVRSSRDSPTFRPASNY